MAQLTPEVRKHIRKTMIDIASRRQRPGTGSLSVLPEEHVRLDWPDLTHVLVDVPWAVVGGVATRMYMPERHTKDLDIVISAEDSDRVRALLTSAGFELKGPLSIPGSGWLAPDGTPIDVLEIAAAWIDDALLRAAQNRDQTGAPIITLPYLVLMKLRSGRFQDVADIGRMLTAASPAQVEEVRDLVRRFEPDAVEDMNSTIALAKLELGEGNP